MYVKQHALRYSLCLVALQIVMPSANAAAALVPEDTCILKVEAPLGAKVTLNGKEYGSQREFTFRGLKKGTLYSLNVVIESGDGKRIQKALRIMGGWQLRLPLPVRRSTAPRLVAQTGHTGGIFSMSLTSDGKYLATASLDGSVIIWDVSRGVKLKSFDRLGVSGVAISPDGRYLATASTDRTLSLWDLSTGTKTRTFAGNSQVTQTLAFSRDGKYLATGSVDGVVVVWNFADGKKLHALRAFDYAPERAPCVAFSPDGRTLATGGIHKARHAALLWDVATGRQLRHFVGHGNSLASVAFSPNGKLIATCSYVGHDAILWNATSGRKIHTLRHSGGFGVNSIAFSPDGKLLATAGGKNSAYDSAVLWNVADGRFLRTYQARNNVVPDQAGCLAFSPDGKQLGIGTGYSNAVILFDVKTGDKHRVFPGNSGVSRVAFSPGSEYLATGKFWEGRTPLWSMNAGQLQQSFFGDRPAFSPDGRLIATTGQARVDRESVFPTANLWEVAGGRKVRTLIKREREREKVAGAMTFNALAFSQNGKELAAAGPVGTITIFDVDTGRESRSLAAHDNLNLVSTVAYSRNGKLLASGSSHKSAIVWQTATWRKLQSFHGSQPIASVDFNPDGKKVVIATGDGSVLLGDIETGRSHLSCFGHQATLSADGSTLGSAFGDSVIIADLKAGRPMLVLSGHTHAVNSIAFNATGNLLASGSADGTTRLWEIASGKELCSLISLDAGKDWLVVTPEGLFDGSPGGRQKVMFRVGSGLNVVPVDRFFQDFYRPGLLAAIWKGERPMPTADFGAIAKSKPPTLKIVSPKAGGEVDASSVQIAVDVTEQGGGVKGPIVRLNGQRIELKPGVKELGKLRRFTFTVPLTEAQNRIRIEAVSRDGAWESEPAIIQFTNTKKLPKPNLYVVAIGVNKYKSGSMNLAYARTDAEAVADLFEKRAKSLYANVAVHRLADKQATAKSIKETLTNAVAAKARPQDTLVVFVSGHGFTVGQRYYFLPHEFEKKAAKIEDDIRKHGIPSDVLGDWISSVKATKRIVIMDTCNSGAAIAQVGRTRNPFAFDGAIERLGRASGIFVIAAAPATADAREIRTLKHGILTYSLLAGVKAAKTGPLSERSIKLSGQGTTVSVSQWFDFASETVPSLYKLYLGTAQDVKTYAQGTPFPVLPLEQ